MTSSTSLSKAISGWIGTKFLIQSFDSPDFSFTVISDPIFDAEACGRPGHVNVHIAKSPDLVADGVGKRSAELGKFTEVYERPYRASSGKWKGEESLCRDGLYMTLNFGWRYFPTTFPYFPTKSYFPTISLLACIFRSNRMAEVIMPMRLRPDPINISDVLIRI